MFTDDYYRGKINGEYYCVDFEDFIPSSECPEPDARIHDFMVNYPYVLVTDGVFETEYFYEREKILAEDYLAPGGGERAVAPYLGLTEKNAYLGSKENVWKKGFIKWGALRFDNETDSCNDALFLTEQRNCVCYAAVYVRCKKEYDAVLRYETSGSQLFLNGELIDDKPYGRVKGLWGFENTVPAHFQKGLNLLLIKVRPGYICDTMDMCVACFTMHPVLARSGGLGICYPTKTAAYRGTKENPLQVLPTFVAALSDTKGGDVSLTEGKFTVSENLPEMKAGTVGVVRLSAPAEKSGMLSAKLSVTENGTASSDAAIHIATLGFDGFTGKEYVYSDFHFDTTYHQEQRTYALGAMDILRKMLINLRDNPDFKAILSEVDYLHPYYSIYPKDRKTLKDAFILGRAEADCFYNQPNEMTSSGEGFVRNLIYGQLYHRDVLGRKTYVYAPGDVFGHPNQLSQLCAKGGCQGVRWCKHIFGLDVMFKHMSPDGTALLHERSDTGRENALSLGIKTSHESSKLGLFNPYPRKGDTSWMKDTLNGARFAVMSDFSNEVLSEDNERLSKGKRSYFETTSRDISLYHAGVSLTRQDLKTANRLAENLLISAEKFSAIASYYGAVYPDDALDKAWRQLLCGQHHDSITGTNNEVSYVDLMIEYREAVELASGIVNDALSFIAKAVKKEGKGFAVAVFNPHAHARRDVCRTVLPVKKNKQYIMKSSSGKSYPVDVKRFLSDGKSGECIFVPCVPSLGYEVFYLAETEQKALRVARDENTIENEFYSLRVDPGHGGAIVSVYDKKAKKEVINKQFAGSALWALREAPERMEAQHEFYTTGEKISSLDCVAEVKRTVGEAASELVITGRLGTLGKFVNKITLVKGVKRIDFKLYIEDYRGEDNILTYTIPVDIKGARPVFDDRFAPAVRPESRGLLDFKTHQYAMFSHCSVFAANQWFAYGPTLTLSIGKSSVNTGAAALIAHNSPALEASVQTVMSMLTKKGIPVTPYPDKKRVVRGTLLPHFNEDLHFTDTRFVLSLSGVKNEYEEKIKTENPKAYAEFLQKLELNGAAALYVTDSDNSWNKPVDVILIKGKTEELLNNYTAELEFMLNYDYRVTLESSVSAVRGKHSENYSAAIINKGNLAGSVEKGGVLNLMLFHTAAFYGNSGKVTGGKELIPESKTHVYEFAFVPSEGSFREADIYNKALDYNDGLFACVSDKNKQAFLPEKKSFLSVSDGFVLTAFKLSGTPAASLKKQIPAAAERGFTVRGFLSDGIEDDIKLDFSFPVKDAQKTDLLLENPEEAYFSNKSVYIPSHGYSVETVVVKPKNVGVDATDVHLGAVREPIQPVYIRSWEHSKGSMPFGYLSFAGVIDRKVNKLSETELSFNVSAVNNSTDSAVNGKMRLKLPKGFKASATEFSYDLESGDYKIYPVTITKPSADAAGIVYLTYSDGENGFYDALEIGGAFNPTLTVEINEQDVSVTVFNDTDENLFGELLLAVPCECFGGYPGFGMSVMDVSPYAVKADVPSHSSQKYTFAVKQTDNTVFNAFFAAAKLCINGKVYYGYAKLNGARHQIWAHEFIREIEKNKGSYKAYMELNE